MEEYHELISTEMQIPFRVGRAKWEAEVKSWRGFANCPTFDLLVMDEHHQANHDKTFKELLEYVAIGDYELLATNFQLSSSLKESIEVADLEVRQEGIYINKASWQHLQGAEQWQRMEALAPQKHTITKRKKI